MLNLKELSERYKDVGLGYIRFGGKSYYEINSDISLSLNSFGGSKEFVLNDKEEVELFDISDKVLVKRHYFLIEDWNEEYEVNYETQYYWDETTPNNWWGKTLDNYYPHPWYPDKKIVAFELINDIPFFRKGKVVKVKNNHITFNLGVNYSVDDCLHLVEFFKPLYDE